MDNPGGGAFSGLLFAAAGMGVHAARPLDWSMRGYDPTIILGGTLGTELEVLESIADGFNPGIQANSERINRMSGMLRWAGRLLLAAPLVAVLAYLSLSLAPHR